MNDIISDCLSDQWAMFYCPSVPINQLVSVQTLDKAVAVVNQSLVDHGRFISTWPAGLQDEIARLLWVNWIYQRLDIEPIRKPVLTHYSNDQFIVDCGDTRLMSLRLYNPDSCVAVINTCSLDQATKFSHWTRISNSQQLKSAAGFNDESVILATPGQDCCLSWLEIGDQTTAHHLHSVDQRVDMIQCYLNQQPEDFKFTTMWFKLSIDWARYQSN